MTLAVPKSTTVEKFMSLLTPNTLFVPARNNTSFEAFQIDVCIHFHLNTYLVFKALISSVLETMLHFYFTPVRLAASLLNSLLDFKSLDPAQSTLTRSL